MWLHFTTKSVTYRYYKAIERNIDTPSNISAGYKPKDQCQNTSARLACSVTNVPNVVDPEKAYLILGEGINQRTGNFQDTNFVALDRNIHSSEGTGDQVITYSDLSTGKNHSLLFNILAAQENDLTEEMRNSGIDLKASSTSMSTQCSFITQNCIFHNNVTDSQNDSIPFNCSAQFYGDLAQTDNNTVEAVRGLNTNFSNIIANPFSFFAAAALNTLSKNQSVGRDPIYTSNGNLLPFGSSRFVFAVNCTATIYNVTYSLINGSIATFDPIESAPQIAEIIQAPLRIGFGSNYLYQQAALSQISVDSFPNLLAQRFSEAGIAGSYGAFQPIANIVQRPRYDWTVTRVSKKPLILLVTICLLYTFLGLVIMGVGLHVRRRKEVRHFQAKILPPSSATQFGLKDALEEAVGAENQDVGTLLKMIGRLRDELNEEKSERAGLLENRE